MKLVFDSQKLLQGLEVVKLVVTSNTIVPVCNNVLFKVKDGEIVMVATNTHHSIVHTIKCESKETGKVLIPFSDIYNLCKSLPSCPIEIDFKEKSIGVKWETGTYNIQSTDEVIDFPKIIFVTDPRHSVDLDTSVIEGIQQKSLKFIHQDPTVANMHGICFDFSDGNLNVVALDLHIMSVNKVTCGSFDKDNLFIVQKKAIELLTAFTKESFFTMKFDFDRFQVENPTTVLVTRLVDEKYPAYKNAVVENPFSIEIEKECFLKSISRAKQFSGVNDVGLIVDQDSIEIIADNHELGKGFSEKYPLVDSKVEGEIKIGLNIKYLLDALSACDSEVVTVQLKGEKSSVIISERDNKDSFIQMGAYKYFN